MLRAELILRHHFTSKDLNEMDDADMKLIEVVWGKWIERESKKFSL